MGLADELLIIHRAITRALGVAHERGQQYAERGFGDAVAEKGYRDFGRCLVRLVNAHHDAEEEIIFPRLRPLMTSVPFAELEAQHHELHDSLDATAAALDSADAGAAAGAWLDRFVPAIGRVRASWTAHIAVEEAHVTQPAIDAALDGAAQGELAKTISERAQKNSHTPQLTIPFVLYNLGPGDRAHLQGRFPAQLVGMVDGPWKEQWAPMKCLLLD